MKVKVKVKVKVNLKDKVLATKEKIVVAALANLQVDVFFRQTHLEIS